MRHPSQGKLIYQPLGFKLNRQSLKIKFVKPSAPQIRTLPVRQRFVRVFGGHSLFLRKREQKAGTDMTMQKYNEPCWRGNSLACHAAGHDTMPKLKQLPGLRYAQACRHRGHGMRHGMRHGIMTATVRPPPPRACQPGSVKHSAATASTARPHMSIGLLSWANVRQSPSLSGWIASESSRCATLPGDQEFTQSLLPSASQRLGPGCSICPPLSHLPRK